MADIANEAPTGGLTPHMQIGDKGAAEAIHFYRTAFGATEVMPLEDMLWGDRYGQVKDPFGYRWSIAHSVPESA